MFKNHEGEDIGKVCISLLIETNNNLAKIKIVFYSLQEGLLLGLRN